MAEFHSAYTEFWRHTFARGTSGRLCDAQLRAFSDVRGQTKCHERLGAGMDATALLLQISCCMHTQAWRKPDFKVMFLGFSIVVFAHEETKTDQEAAFS